MENWSCYYGEQITELLESAEEFTGRHAEDRSVMTTYEEHLARVTLNGTALRDVPEEFHTPELCLAAVQEDGSALGLMHWPQRTEEVCLAAVQEDRTAICFVPDHHEEMICTYLKLIGKAE